MKRWGRAWLGLGFLIVSFQGLAVGAATFSPDIRTPATSSLVYEGDPRQDSVHDETELEGGKEHGITHRMLILMLQLGVILFIAKLCGELTERFFHQPAVLGELVSGMLIGPHALGPYLAIFGSDPLFVKSAGALFPVSPELYGIATMASVVLLFMVGLETDFQRFMRFAGSGFAVGVGGVVFSFVTGAWLYCEYADAAFMSPGALFMGTVSTATSVGITARVLSEQKKLDSAEGTTILAGAVIDDVLGILLLAVVGGIAATSAQGGSVDWGQIGGIALKAVGFLVVVTLLGVWSSERLRSFLLFFKRSGATVPIGLALALLLAGIAETFGLAMIIGAYTMGLILSRTSVAHYLENALRSVYDVMVPVFFAVMGMLVDFSAMKGALGFGLVYSLVAIISKVVGSGLPGYFLGFNSLGVLRIGIGMLPRGEVALIVAGIGVSQGYIGTEMFGVVILMTLLTTLTAPPLLVKLFNQSSGVKGEEVAKPIKKQRPELQEVYRIDNLTWTNHDMLITCLRSSFEKRDMSFTRPDASKNVITSMGKGENRDFLVAIEDHPDRIELKTMPEHRKLVEEILEEAKEDALNRIRGIQIHRPKIQGAKAE